MNFIHYFSKKILIFNYNHRKKTKIHSVLASLRGKYGLNVLISENTYVAENVEIGDYSYVNSNSYIENCIIGKFCSISSGVYICPFEHDYSKVTTHPIMHSNTKNHMQKVIIGNDVLISLNAIILRGVTIGDGAVIGAGAVVTKNVKPYEIVGGVPAKHIKYRFSESKISKLLEVRWWEWGIEKIDSELLNLDDKLTNINNR